MPRQRASLQKHKPATYQTNDDRERLHHPLQAKPHRHSGQARMVGRLSQNSARDRKQHDQRTDRVQKRRCADIEGAGQNTSAQGGKQQAAAHRDLLLSKEQGRPATSMLATAMPILYRSIHTAIMRLLFGGRYDKSATAANPPLVGPIAREERN